MSGVVENRSIAYSADTAGRAGRIACQVIRSDSLDDGRISYAIAIRNDTGSDAQARASVPDALDLRHRTIVHSVIAAHSLFSTAVELAVERAGEIPELHVQLSGEDIDFALIVPNAYAGSGREVAAPPRLALAAVPRANGSGLPAPNGDPHRTVALHAVPRAASRRDYPLTPRAPDFGRKATESPPALYAPKSPSAIPVFVVFIAIMFAVGFAVAQPQIRELAVPPQAQAQTSTIITYRATGFGSTGYRVLSPEGEHVASGSLATGAGTFAITLPKEPGDRTYLVRVAIAGILGAASTEGYIKVGGAPLAVSVPARPTHPRAVAPPQIRSLALDRANPRGGDTLNVYYDVSASSGTVALLDAGSQIAYGKSDFSPSGHTAFVIPNLPSERFLTLVLTAHRGTATTQSRVAVTAEPQSSPSPQADAGGAGAEGSDASLMAVPVVDAPKRVGSAQLFRVTIHDAVAGLAIVLKDDTGKELERKQFTVDSSQSSATFTAPHVRVRTQVRLEASYPEGAGSETIVKTIDITPS